MFNYLKKYQQYGLLVLCFFLGAIASQFIQGFYNPVQRIETLDITGIYKQFVKETARLNLSKEKANERVSTFAKSLDLGVQYFSKKHHAVILPSEAVIGGAKDITSEFSSWMNQRVSK